MHAQRTRSFETEDDPGHVEMIQNVIGRCLEKEELCNEFYMQLVKQTTDQPDPNSKINVSNWRLFALTLGVVVPRNKVCLCTHQISLSYIYIYRYIPPLSPHVCMYVCIYIYVCVFPYILSYFDARGSVQKYCFYGGGVGV